MQKYILESLGKISLWGHVVSYSCLCACVTPPPPLSSWQISFLPYPSTQPLRQACVYMPLILAIKELKNSIS